MIQSGAAFVAISFTKKAMNGAQNHTKQTKRKTPKMKTQNHTPGPWRTWTDGGHISVIEVKNPLEICAVTLYKDGRHNANADFIVRACNSHAELVEALERLQTATTKMLAGGYNRGLAEMHNDIGNAGEAARAALQKAGAL